ncbi:MAG TPA: DNA translocase FtsK [Candidatus Paceibacterota bacterium]
MSKRRKRQRYLSFQNPFSSLNADTTRSVWAILLFILAFFLTLAGVGSAGVAGNFVFTGLYTVFGWGYPLLPTLLLLIAFTLIKPLETHEFGFVRIMSALIFFLAGMGIIELMAGKGGIVGTLIATPLVQLFEVYVTIFILWGLALIALIILLDLSVTTESFPLLQNFLGRRDSDSEDEEYTINNQTADNEEEEEEDIDREEDALQPAPPLSLSKQGPPTDAEIPFAPVQGGSYTTPPLSLLEKDKGKPGVGDIKANANIIKRTLQNFGITVEIDEISIGPSVTRYALKPAEGVRLSRIMGLQNNLELALAAHPVRIEAPIPGRSLVGIEVPNTAKTTVGLATLLADENFQKSDKPLLVALGKDITGQSHLSDIAKMPHLLIAGTTGSGKSVTIHAIITSLLFRNSPEMMRFIMVDPKRVELTLYNNIPHLLTPVITDAKKTILALKWAAKEMDRRYDILEAERVRDIGSYHKTVLEPALAQADKDDAYEMPEAMPYIVIVIDELADIMQAYPRELESAIVRLAQMSRAVGIHLLLSTQRPSVNVITGLIKANIPARIALQVSSQIDSRTILDTGGAEKLLGAGDMLYLSGEMSKPKRIQSAFISETELKKVTSFLIKHSGDNVPNEIHLSESHSDDRGSIFEATLDDEDDEDDLYQEAKDIVIRAGKASTSYLQRKLRIGYARAARLMDLLEEKGVIGPADGSRPREVIADRDEDSETTEEATERE